MKFDNVTQWVRVGAIQVPPDQSLANKSVEKSAGKPDNGSPKPDGTRMQDPGSEPALDLIQGPGQALY